MKFFCDIMLGKLAKYLRILGFDTRYEKKISEQELLLIAQQETRVILTRTNRLRNKKEIIFLDTDEPKEQLKIVLKKLGLGNRIRPFSRCLVCNEELIKLDRDAVKDKVPYFTFRTQNLFAQCPVCQRIYWPGSHLANMKKFLASIGL